MGLLISSVLIGIAPGGCSDSSSDGTASATGAGPSSSSSGGSSASGTGGTSSASGAGGAGGTGGSSNEGGAGGAGGMGGDGGGSAEVPGSLASGFTLSSYNGVFDVSDSHVYVLQDRKLSQTCCAQVIRFPKDGGPKEVIMTYGNVDDVYEGAIVSGRFYWTGDFRLWSVPLAGGAPSEMFWIQGGQSRQMAVNSTHAFVSQINLDFTLWKIPLTGGSSEAIHSFSGVDPGSDIAADDAYVFLIEEAEDGMSMELTKIPLAGGPSETLATGPFISGLALDDANVYFAMGGSLNVVPKSGGPVTTLSPGINVESIDVDDTHVYWAEYGSTTAKVLRVEKTGGGMAEIIADNQEGPSAVRLDDSSVYWATWKNGAIWKAPK